MPGRSDEQDAARDMRAQPAEFVGAFQEIHDLMQLGFRFVDARDAIERHFHIGFRRDQLGSAATDAEQASGHPAAHAPRREHPNADK